MRKWIDIAEGKIDTLPDRCPGCGGEIVYEDELIEGKKDACYYKVKSRVKVWPSAYASGQLVQCPKRGSGNWGNGSKK